MTLEVLLSRLNAIFERARVAYMLTGSVASSAHGLPRSTRDLDIVISPTSEQLRALIREFSTSEYYADEEQALKAFERRSQFNIIDHFTGWKIDFIFAEDSVYGRIAFARRKVIVIGSQSVWVASPEDVLIAKLRWAKMSGSERQLQDASGIVSMQSSNLDYTYINRWVAELGLRSQWQAVHEETRNENEGGA